MASNSEWLARKLLELEQQVQALGRGTRLGHSSLQGGSILALDEDGKVLAELGTDGGAGGVVHLDGPEPPRPTAPVLEQGVGTIFVRWDGGWDPIDEGDEGEPPTTPIDFDRIEVHATTDPEATEWDEDTLAGSITQRNGGVVMIRGWDIDDVVYVRLVCRSLADKVSEPSEPAEVTVTGIDIAAIVDELDAANLELSNLDGTMFAVGAELDALAITFKNLDTSVINTDDGTLAEALDDARQALEDLNAGQSQLREDLDAVVENAQGGSNYYQPTPPPGTDHTEDDLWFDTSEDEDGLTHYTPHRWDGQRWVSLEDERVQAIQDAQAGLESDLNTVRDTADGKNSITWSPDTPSGEGRAGDTWFRTSGNNIIGHWRHSGSAWVSMSLDATVIPNLDAGVINSGHIDSARIAAASITADKILVGGAGNLLTNPGFTGDGAGWNIATYNPIITDSGGPTGEPVLSMQGASAIFPYLGGLGQSAAGSFAPDLAAVEAGKRYAASVWVRAEVDIPVGNAGMGFRLRELGSATLGWAFPGTGTNSEVIPANTWAKIEAEILVPTDTGTWNRLAFGLRANGALNGRRVEFSAPVLLPKVGATLIEGGAITTDKIATGAITAESGVIGSLDASKITVGELDGARIKADAITADKIAANAIGARAIAADAVEAGKIAADSISGREIIANTVKAEHIAAFTITADELAANSVSTDKLVSNSVIADKLAANSVIAEKIDALAVTADKVAANAITADKIAANAITAGKIDSDAINGMVITGATVRTNASGARVEMNADGLVQYNAQGQPIVDMTGGTFSTVGSLQTGRPGDRRVIISNEVWNNPGTGIVFVPEDGEVAPAHASRIGTPYRKWLEIAVEEDWTTSGYRSRARFRDVSLELTHCAMTGTVQDGPYSTLRLGTHSTGTQNPGEWYLGSATKTPADPSSVWASHVGGTLDGVSLVSQDGFAWIRGGGNVQVDAGLGGARMDMQNSRIDTTAPTSIVFSTGGGGDLSISNDSTNPFMRSRAVMNRTYGYAANVYITTSGILGKSTSARRYKTDEQEIAPAEYADALLSIPFKSWLDKKQVEQCAELEQFREDNPYCPTPEYLAEGAEGPARHVGAVAEDFIDAGLEQFVTFDQYGRADGLQYDRIGVALIPIIKGMKEQIDRLEAANGIGE